MPVMHTAIPCTSSTADQVVSTVHVQLGAAKHLTRPLTVYTKNNMRASKTRQGKTKTRQGVGNRRQRQGKTRQDKTRQDKTAQDKANETRPTPSLPFLVETAT